MDYKYKAISEAKSGDIIQRTRKSNGVFTKDKLYIIYTSANNVLRVQQNSEGSQELLKDENYWKRIKTKKSVEAKVGDKIFVLNDRRGSIIPGNIHTLKVIKDYSYEVTDGCMLNTNDFVVLCEQSAPLDLQSLYEKD